MNLTPIEKLDLKLVGQRLTLRRVIEKDINDTYLSWLNDPDVSQFLETRWQNQTTETLTAYVRKMSKSTTELLFKILISNSDRHIGNIKIGPIDTNHRSSELSYFIGAKEEWRNGYATEAIGLVVEFSFKFLGIHKIQAGCYESNIGSQKALSKAGFDLEGRLRKKILGPDGDWQDHLWFGLICP